MAGTQRISGGDDPAWPDERGPVPRARRRRWPWVVALAVAMLGLGSFVVWNRADGHTTTIGLLQCNSSRFRGMSIDYGGNRGFTSEAAALAAFLKGPQLPGMPSSGYRLISGSASPYGSDPTYVHRRRGRVDVTLRLEHVGPTWEVAEVRTCA